MLVSDLADPEVTLACGRIVAVSPQFLGLGF